MNENNWQKRGPYKHMPNSSKILKYIYKNWVQAISFANYYDPNFNNIWLQSIN